MLLRGCSLRGVGLVFGRRGRARDGQGQIGDGRRDFYGQRHEVERVLCSFCISCNIMENGW